MARVLLAWIGKTDLRAASGDAAVGAGPIAHAVAERGFDHLVLLNNHPGEEVAPFTRWLRKKTKASIVLRQETLSTPTHHADIYRAVMEAVAWSIEQYGKRAKRTFHLSAGTPAMAAIWILVAKTRFEAELIESSPQTGVQTADVPFELAAELIPAAVRRTEEELARLSGGFRPDEPGFSDIVHRSEAMKRLLHRARQAAGTAAPVLIHGESGTGKELLARAIHQASPRAAGPFVAVNCGALPRELVDSEFFGHTRGAFPGAAADHQGHLGRATGGTLFLDEVGELPPDAQVKLLRALQEKKIRPVGGRQEVPVDVRIIAATNRDLMREVGQGRFHEDLFYRLAILVLHTPPLREREGDVGLLTDQFLARLNNEARPGGIPKKLSPAARNHLLRHPWPGNVRELEGTLWRAFVWAHGPVIDVVEVREALFVREDTPRDAVLGQPLGDGFSLEETIAHVVRHYLERAMKEANHNKTRAAALIGFRSYQRLKQWLDKYGVEA
ncbi:sigma-54 dependent transcriptional regulator [Sorangium sp. So ce302]|uniref:sigma-54 interaction domain-containing protein n=1 Tax=Sorangium sp. So ce302 TaxID=3133297 RepID=UPI003F5D74DD